MKETLQQLRHRLLFCTVIILSHLPLYAQLTQRVITVTRSSMDIPSLARTIAAQTGVEYSLNMQNTSLKKYVHLKPGKWKLEEVMKAVQEQAGLNYKILGDHILFTDYKPVKKVDSVRMIKPDPVHVAKPAKKIVKPTVKTAVIDSENLPAMNHPAFEITPLYTDYHLPPPTVHVKPGHVTNRELKAAGTNSVTQKVSKERRQTELPDWFSPLEEAGITANDIVYLSASVKAGIQYVYGIGTWGFSSKGMRFRYGAGLRVTLNESSALHAEFTTGTLSRTSIDTFPQKGKIHERLNSFGLSWSKAIKPRLQLQLELNYSTLKKTNDSTVNKVSPETDYFAYGKQLYPTTISPGGNNAQQTGWIGARISLFYNLRRR